MQRITIVGLGWLGLPLAQAWQLAGGVAYGSCRTAIKQQQLLAGGIQAFCWQAGTPPDLPPAEGLVLALPPGQIARAPGCDYATTLHQLVQAASLRGYQQVLHVSSTGVYGAADTGDDAVPVHPDSERGELLWRAEQAVRQGGLPWTIVRSAGQIGPGRHPGRFLSGREVKQGGAPVNLVHQQDLVRMVTALLQRGARGETFNLCAPDHPSRSLFYGAASRQLGLPLPVFQDQLTSGRCIDGRRVAEVVGCDYAVSDLMAWLSVA